jgi:hypothetical protein
MWSMTARISCLRSVIVVVAAWKTVATSAPARRIQAASSSVRVTGRWARWAARRALKKPVGVRGVLVELR